MIRSLIVILTVVSVGLGLAFVGGCESDAQTGAALGGLGGAGIGAIIGHQSGKTTEGALIGGAVGAGTGYVVGSEQDKQKTRAEIEQLRQDMDTVTVNITNSNGSVSQVKLKKQGPGYVGPRGEYYDKLPTEAELKPVYGF